jgi:LPS O-antigen subunit length determinant protein (WzzB/FepE family)
LRAFRFAQADRRLQYLANTDFLNEEEKKLNEEVFNYPSPPTSPVQKSSP